MIEGMTATKINIKEVYEQIELSLQRFELEYGQQLAPFQQKMYMIGYGLGLLEKESSAEDKEALKVFILNERC